MSYARFHTREQAQAYADNAQAELEATNIPGEPRKYHAERWAEVQAGTDGHYYVDLFDSIPAADVVSSVPLPETEQEQ